MKENDQLQDMIRITEKDTIECFTLLQKKDEEKKNEVRQISCLIYVKYFSKNQTDFTLIFFFTLSDTVHRIKILNLAFTE